MAESAQKGLDRHAEMQAMLSHAGDRWMRPSLLLETNGGESCRKVAGRGWQSTSETTISHMRLPFCAGL